MRIYAVSPEVFASTKEQIIAWRAKWSKEPHAYASDADLPGLTGRALGRALVRARCWKCGEQADHAIHVEEWR